MHFAEKATGYEAKIYPGNKKSPLIQGLDEFNHKTTNYASKKRGKSASFPFSIRDVAVLNLQDLFFLVGKYIVYLCDKTVGRILDLFFTPLQIVL